MLDDLVIKSCKVSVRFLNSQDLETSNSLGGPESFCEGSKSSVGTLVDFKYSDRIIKSLFWLVRLPRRDSKQVDRYIGT